ncbi:YjhT family mutarotase [Vibrio sp. NH-UV-68]|uniref:YjhT family mutarotase n=1 Tax=unclassified Vibrio TaxID=2614977 RepID=UPI0036F39A26
MPLSMVSYPDFPDAIKNAVGARIDDRIFAGLGTAGKQFYCLDLNSIELGWKSMAPFIGVIRNDAVMVASGNSIWVFSGAGIDEDSEYTQVLTDVYRFDVTNNQWEKISSKTPVGLLGASGCEIAPGKIAFWGGYNKPLFDDFLAKIGQIDGTLDPEKHQATLVEFMSMRPEQYGWNQDIWLFDCETLQWRILTANPFPANCGASLIQHDNQIVLVDGEIKPGLRSTEIKQFTFHSGDKVKINTLPSIEHSPQEHEGLAGAYAGLVKGQYVVAGGAFFVGSQNQAREKQWYTHQGLSKHYADDIWCFEDQQWQRIGTLPVGQAYGISITSEQGLVIIGGENAKGHALQSCYLLG